MEDIIDIIVTETTNLIEITSQPTDEIIDVNIIDNREDVTLNVTPTLVEININSLTGNFGVNWGEIAGTLSNQTDLQNALNLKADLVDGKVPSSQLPSYVDDVVEVANYAALPVTGEVGKIYITLDTNYIYRWTGSTYVEIKDSSAVWGAITGTLSNQTDLQNALNLKANDSLVVHLAGTETITGAKTFLSAVMAPNFVLSVGTGNTGLYYGHTDRVVLANYTAGGIDFEVNGGSIVATLFPSGNYGLGITLDAGYKLDVNGTARISGALSGTSASFSSSVTASSIIKSGGTSSQFLKADGSLDSTSYQPLLTNPVTGTGTSGIVAIFNGTSSITDSSIYANSTRVSIGADVTTTNRFTAVASTSSSYAVVAQASGAANGFWATLSGTGEIFRGQTAGGSYFIINNGGNAFLNGNLNVGDFASTSYRLNVVGTANFTGALSGTSATFSGLVTGTGLKSQGISNGLEIVGPTGAPAYGVTDQSVNNAGKRWRFGHSGAIGGFGSFDFYNQTDNITALTLASTGAATFSSSVTTSGNNIFNNSGGRAIDAVSTGVLFAQNGGAHNIIFGDGNVRYFSLFTPSGAAYGSIRNFSTSTDILTFTSSGNVGIGTTAPTVAAGMGLVINGGATSPRIALKNNASGDASTDGFQLVLTTENEAVLENRENASMRFLTNATEAMRITSSGNVGIGTTSPTSLLDVKSSTPAISINSTNTSNASTLLFKYSDSYVAEINAVAGSGQMNFNVGPSAGWGGYMSFKTDTSERMRITSAGLVAIGTTSALINESALAVTSGGNTATFKTTLNGGNGLLVWNSITNGNPGFISFGTEGSYTERGYIYYDRTAGQVKLSATSDARLKKDIIDAPSVLPLLEKIKVRQYKWKENNNENIGFIAQELYEVIERAVSVGEDLSDGSIKRAWGVDNGTLVPYLVKAIQEIYAELKALKA